MGPRQAGETAIYSNFQSANQVISLIRDPRIRQKLMEARFRAARERMKKLNIPALLDTPVQKKEIAQ